MFRAFPFMAVSVASYNAVAIGMGLPMSTAVLAVALPSGVELAVSVGDLLTAGALLMLFIELMASTGARTSSIVNHGLSVLVLNACVVEFLLVPACATTAFALITLLSLVDVVAGASISIATARRDWALADA